MKRIIAAILIIVILITSVDLPAFADSEHPINFPGTSTTGYEYGWDYLTEYATMDILVAQLSGDMKNYVNLPSKDRDMIRDIKKIYSSLGNRTMASFQDGESAYRSFSFKVDYLLDSVISSREIYQEQLTPLTLAMYDIMFGTEAYYHYEGINSSNNVFNDFTIPINSDYTLFLYLFNIGS